MTYVLPLSIIATFTSLVGLSLNYTKNYRLHGAVLGLVAQPLWLGMAVLAGTYGMILGTVVYVAVYTHGIRQLLKGAP